MCAIDNSKHENHSKVNQSKGPKRRRKYSRPCDRCALRKIRCSDVRPCVRCISSNIQCTSSRIRKKCGPKAKKDKQNPKNDQTKSYSTSSDSSSIFSVDNLTETNSFLELEAVLTSPIAEVNPSIKISDLICCLQAYQKWFYKIWPVVSISKLIYCLSNINFQSSFNFEDSLAYALSLSVSAAITNQVDAFFEPSMDMPPLIAADHYALEALRVREYYGHKVHPTTESLLTSYYLYLYSSNTGAGTETSIGYLKEAISTSQILGLNDPINYLSKTSQEAHILSKIYYLLVVTERVNCIQPEFQLVLNTSIPLPTLFDDEYPNQLIDFIDLLKMFVDSEQLTLTSKLENGLYNLNESNSSNAAISMPNFFESYS